MKTRPELLSQPKTGSPMELAYLIMRDAEATDDQFRAMDLHEWLLDLDLEHPYQDILGYMRERIGANQVRLGLQPGPEEG